MIRLCWDFNIFTYIADRKKSAVEYEKNSEKQKSDAESSQADTDFCKIKASISGP